MEYHELADLIIEHPEKASNNLKQQYLQCKSDWVEKPITEDEYVRFSNRLAQTPVDYSNVLGYLATTGHHLIYCKYNKKTENFVVYSYHNESPVVITFFKKLWREFDGDKWTEYYDEIPSGK